MGKIIVTQSKKTQKRVLRIADGLSYSEIQSIIDSMDKNEDRFKSGESQKVYQAYQKGWRGNDTANVSPLNKNKTLINRLTEMLSFWNKK